MADALRVKTFRSPDGKRRIEILNVGNGLFRFARSEFVLSRDEIDRQNHGEGYWTIETPSGLYSSAEEAEAGARAETSWMQELPR